MVKYIYINCLKNHRKTSGCKISRIKGQFASVGQEKDDSCCTTTQGTLKFTDFPELNWQFPVICSCFIIRRKKTLIKALKLYLKHLYCCSYWMSTFLRGEVLYVTCSSDCINEGIETLNFFDPMASWNGRLKYCSAVLSLPTGDFSIPSQTLSELV